MSNSKRRYIKALETLVYLAEREKRNYWILKAIYFADKEHLRRYGRQLFGDSYRAMKQGPVPSLAYDIIKWVRGDGYFEFANPDPGSAIDIPDKYTILPKRKAHIDYLSKSEIECLDFALDLVSPLDFDALKTLSHDSAYNAVQQDEEMSLDSIINSLENCTEVMEYMYAA
jgi:hypothetical protein